MKLLNILTVFLLILPIAIAQDFDFDSDFGVDTSNIDIDKSANWIMSQPRVTTSDAALAVLVAIKSDIINNQDAIDDLVSLKSKTSDCWPSSGCNSKDTAIALLAVAKSKAAVSFDQLNEKPATGGEWLLQIETQSTGTCTVGYTGGSKEIQVENSRIKSDLCPFSTLFNLNSCLESNLLSDKASLDISVNCGQLGSSKISLVHRADGKYFVVDQVSPNAVATLKIKNSNLGDYESTLYGSWALKSAGHEVNSIIWLKRFYTPGIESSSIMYLLTGEPSYVDDLVVLQDSSGSFGSVYETGIATLALRKEATHTIEEGLAKDWLEYQVDESGSWNNNIQDTAMAIYGAFASLDIDITSPISSYEPSEPQEVCNNDGSCDSYLGEDSSNCPSDCTCGDGICDSAESEFSCLEDCPTTQDFDDVEPEDDEGRGFFSWLIIILLVLGIPGAGYFYYKYYYQAGKQLFKRKGPKQPPLFKPQYKQPQRRYQQQPASRPKPRKSLIEKQLEKSIEESKKLFEKK